jgi:probable rRNA maturation factor
MFDLTNTTKHASISKRVLSLPFETIAKSILTKKYELSLVLCADRLATKMNKQYRHKTYSPNVLSFSLTNQSGEIFLNLRVAEREAKKYGISLEARIAYLFIHGCVHLKGLNHGPRMESAEKKSLIKFGIDHPLP